MNKTYCDKCGNDITFVKLNKQSLQKSFWDGYGTQYENKEYEFCKKCDLDFTKAVEKLMENFEQARIEYQKEGKAK